MVKNPPDGYQRIIPYLSYEDAPAAIDFLTKAFGFEERMRMPAPDGSVMHAELSIGGEVFMLATANAEMGMVGRKGLPGMHAFVMCYVDDVDAHCAAAKAAGATILAEPEDQFYGDRTYRAMDPEENVWYFATHVKDWSPEDMPQQG